MTAIGRVGVWSGEIARAEPHEAASAAALAEQAGYGAVWLPGGSTSAPFAVVAEILAATTRLVAATGVLNIWNHTATGLATAHRSLRARHGDRFLLGMGVSHAPVVDRAEPGRYASPLRVLASFLDGLDAGGAVPASERVLAALGPKMLALAAVRAAGAHPYHVTPEHTRFAREILGRDPLLAPEQAVVLEKHPARARGLARQHLAVYFGLPNYVRSWRRQGFGDDDLCGGGSDRLVDALVPWGSAAHVGRRVSEHFDAGADHVCVQVIGDADGSVPIREWTELAGRIG
ncbi:LLM class F420-dependent oxidoreductase [Pseudonocardia ailaonensis]|uniref:LLM class F420-dependent oxidoreductase n=1 Tax=Pseudonocardia ailaonensis TaxID=367279 RepID=A0ABN2NCL1_9PSEU